MKRLLISFSFMIISLNFIEFEAKANWFSQKGLPECRNNFFSTTDLSKKARESVVIISTEESSGSGFVVNHVNNQTLLITNSHVVDGAKNTLIKWSDGSEDIASVRFDLGGRTNLTDLALLIVDGKKGKILPFKKDPPLVGSEVIAVGAPRGLDFSFTKGIISSLREKNKIIQTDAAVNPGNSGGPLINKSGCVVGINTFILTESEGLNFAISSDIALDFINKYSGDIKIRKSRIENLEKIVKACNSEDNQNKCKLNKDSLKLLLKADDLINFRSQAKEVISLTNSALDFQKTDFGYFLRARAQSYLGNSDQALQDFTESILINPNLSAAFYYRGIEYMNRDDNKEAIRDFKELENITGGDSRGYVMQGRAYDQLGSEDKAIYYFDEAINFDPDNALAYLLRGGIKLRKEIFSSAIKDFNKAIEIEPDNHLAYRSKGSALQDLGDYMGSIMNFQKSIELKPSSEAYYLLGLSYDDLEQYDLALEAKTNAIEVGNNNAKIYLSRGGTYLNLKMYKAACGDFKVAERLYRESKLEDKRMFAARGVEQFCK